MHLDSSKIESFVNNFTDSNLIVKQILEVLSLLKKTSKSQSGHEISLGKLKTPYSISVQ